MALPNSSDLRVTIENRHFWPGWVTGWVTKMKNGNEIVRNLPEGYHTLPPLLLMLVLWGVGLARWLAGASVLEFVFLMYSGVLVGVGIGGYIALPNRHRALARRFILVLVGGLLLFTAFVTRHGNMQVEGLFFGVLAGMAPYVLIHYAIAKIGGPLLFGRVWCGWACWYGMVFELLPYPYPRYRIPGRWGALRYAHLGVSALLVVVLWGVFGYGEGGHGAHWLGWFITGLALYYAAGIGLALVLKDNHAFCKYLCPIAALIKLPARFSLLKIRGTPENCGDCEACVELCPMNIRIKDYLQQGERVLSTECTLCLTCINVCPHDSLQPSFALDVGGKDIFDFEPPGKNDQRYARRTL